MGLFQFYKKYNYNIIDRYNEYFLSEKMMNTKYTHDGSD